MTDYSVTDYQIIGATDSVSAALQRCIKSAAADAVKDGYPKHIKCCLGRPKCLAQRSASMPEFCGACDIWRVMPEGTVSKVEDAA